MGKFGLRSIQRKLREKIMGLVSKKALKAANEKVEQIFYKVADGVQINIMNLGKISKAGVDAILAEASDADVEKAVADAVAKYREN